MMASDLIWLAADYHCPVTYSCRVPMSSMSSARAMPAPGPATVRLALIRTGIELFGMERTRDELFASIRSIEIRIRPPERVAISTQLVRAYKANEDRSRMGIRLDESLVYREVIHAIGPMTVYVKIPSESEADYREMLMAIGYWGQADSLACCLGAHHTAPDLSQCAMPLHSMCARQSLHQRFACVVSEWRDTQVEWEEVMPILTTRKTTAIRLEVHVWPMVMCECHQGGRLLRRLA